MIDPKLDLKEIRLRYSQAHDEALANNRRLLSYYEIQPWDQILNKVQRKIFMDLRMIGVPLYPIFPYSDTQYLHFANPFELIGIEIVYQNSPARLVERKLKFLSLSGWTIFKIDSRNAYHTIQEFFRIKRRNNRVEWEDLTEEQVNDFAKKFYQENAACLLYYLKNIYFTKSVAR